MVSLEGVPGLYSPLQPITQQVTTFAGTAEPCICSASACLLPEFGIRIAYMCLLSAPLDGLPLGQCTAARLK